MCPRMWGLKACAADRSSPFKVDTNSARPASLGYTEAPVEHKLRGFTGAKSSKAWKSLEAAPASKALGR